MSLTLAINGLDIVLKGFEISQELQSTHSAQTKAKNIAWNTLIIAADGVAIIGDPIGVSCLARLHISFEHAAKAVYVAKKVLGITRATESIIKAEQELSQAHIGKTATLIACSRIFAGSVFCLGEGVKTASELQVFHLNETISFFSEQVTQYGITVIPILDSFQTVHRVHIPRILAFGSRAFRFAIHQTRIIWNRFLNSSFFQNKRALENEGDIEEITRKALDDTDSLLDTPSGRKVAEEYFKKDFYPMPPIYRAWYQVTYRTTEGLLCYLNKKPVVIPIRLKNTDGVILPVLIDFHELFQQIKQKSTLTVFDVSLKIDDLSNVGCIKNDQITKLGNGKLFLDIEWKNYICRSALHPIRQMLREKLSCFESPPEI